MQPRTLIVSRCSSPVPTLRCVSRCAACFACTTPVRTPSSRRLRRRNRRASPTRDRLLDAGVRRLEQQSDVQRPDVRAALMEAAGNAYRGLGAHAEAERLLNEALAFRAHHSASAPLAHSQTLLSQALVKREQGDFERAALLARDAIRILESAGDVDALPRARLELAEILRRRSELTEAAQLATGALTDPASDAIRARALQRPEAANVYLAAIDIYRRTLGPMHPEVATTFNNLGALYLKTQDWARADEAFQQSIAIRMNTIGADHPETAAAQHGRALALNKLERFDEAETLLRQSIATFSRALGADHWRTANARMYLGLVLNNQGRPADAEREMKQAYAVLVRELGDDHPRSAAAREMMSQVAVAAD
jgi:eukaryotic-like serine/threonine-protein kinase